MWLAFWMPVSEIGHNLLNRMCFHCKVFETFSHTPYFTSKTSKFVYFAAEIHTLLVGYLLMPQFGYAAASWCVLLKTKNDSLLFSDFLLIAFALLFAHFIQLHSFAACSRPFARQFTFSDGFIVRNFVFRILFCFNSISTGKHNNANTNENRLVGNVCTKETQNISLFWY